MERRRGVSDQSIGVGILGLGFMGATHLAAYLRAERDGHPCRLAAVASRDDRRRAGDLSGVGGNLDAADAHFDATRVHGHRTADELLADPAVDLVSICTPTHTHAALAERAMRAGKHVLIEKPVSLHVPEIEQLVAVQGETGRVAMPAMCMRFWPGWQSLREQIESAAYGPLQSLAIQRLGARPSWAAHYADASKSGGAIFDLHVHDSDFVSWCLGPPDAVTTVGSIDAHTTLYHYADGPARVSAEGGWHDAGFGFRMRYVAAFAEATLDFDLHRDPPLLLCRDGKATPVALSPQNGYDGQARHLVDALAAGVDPVVSLADAVAVGRLLEAEQASLPHGRRTPVNAS